MPVPSDGTSAESAVSNAVVSHARTRSTSVSDHDHDPEFNHDSSSDDARTRAGTTDETTTIDGVLSAYELETGNRATAGDLTDLAHLRAHGFAHAAIVDAVRDAVAKASTPRRRHERPRRRDEAQLPARGFPLPDLEHRGLVVSARAGAVRRLPQGHVRR